jgi:ankyrin repeat protein
VRCLTLLLVLALSAPASDELFDAARKGDAAAVKVALDRGASVDAKWRYDQTALFIAAFRGHSEVVKLLLEHGAKADVKDSFYGMTALGAAAQKDNAEIVAMLLEKGAISDPQLLPGLARKDNTAVLKAALAKGKWTPESLSNALGVAEAAGKPEAVQVLKAAGAVPKPVVDVDASVLASYAGQYKGTAGPVKVQVVEGKLLLITQSSKLSLRALDQASFEPVEHAGMVKLVFRRQDNKITGVELIQGANTQFLPREESAQ